MNRHGYATDPMSYAYAPAPNNGSGATGAQAHQEPGRFLYGPEDLGQAPQGMEAPQLISSAGDVAAQFIQAHAGEKAAREQYRLTQFQEAGAFPWRAVVTWGLPAAIGAFVVYLVMKE